MKNRILRGIQKLTIALCCFLTANNAQAQFATAAAYPFVASNKPFTYLSGGTPVNFTNYDDNYVQNIPIGFPFTFCGVTYTTVTAQTNGFMSFGNWANYTYPASQSGLQYLGPCVIAGWHDASGSSASATPCTYATLGTAPNRIFILEHKGWGTYPFSSSYITYQYRLYEGGPIEIMYQQEGSSGFGNSTAIGIARTQTDWQSLSNVSANPISSSVTFTTFTGGKPATGQSYLWGLIPCSGVPQFNLSGLKKSCPNRAFQVAVAGASLVSNLTYQWQYSKDSLNWINFTGIGYNANTITDSISETRFYRCKIICTNSGLSYTTAGWRVDIAPFYYCYCLSNTGSAATTGLDIGNVTVINASNGVPLMSKGNPLPALNNTTAGRVYTDYTDSIAPIVSLYRDSVYQFQVTQISSIQSLVSGTAAVFLDWNRDGTYDTITERIVQNTITAANQATTGSFKIPNSAEIGITGMRVIIQKGSPVLPCGNYGEGETEDYIVNLSYEPCKGAVNGGRVEGDSSVCWGYDYIVTDTTYEVRKSGFSRTWQVSGDNKLWFNVPGSDGKDTLMRTFVPAQPLYYRNRLVCSTTNDTSYSQALRVNIKDGYKCYCYSQAVGGRTLDSSDAGGFSLASVVNNDGGTHLMNAKATHKRTDHTDEPPIVIDADSTYQMTIFHTMNSTIHADAKVTVFMDFNNNTKYDLPEDLVYKGYTSIGTFTLVDKISVKPIAIYNVPTGMRVILNNDIAPNLPSDEACGVYTSGETEDYMIIFRNQKTGVNTINGINELGIYPNPTNGKFTLSFKAATNISAVDMSITNVTGQQVKTERFNVSGSQFTKDINLDGQAKGIYFVELRADGQRMIRKLVVE